MKDAEMVAILRAVKGTLLDRSVDVEYEDEIGGLASIIDALEANPPLAEVEGMARRTDTGQLVLSGEAGRVFFGETSRSNRDEYIYVTVTIREKL